MDGVDGNRCSLPPENSHRNKFNDAIKWLKHERDNAEILELREQVRVRDEAIICAQSHGFCSICTVQAKCNLGDEATCPTDEELIKAALDVAKEK